jgi:hypothetical protein
MTDVQRIRNVVLIVGFVMAVTLALASVSASSDRFVGQWTGTYVGDDTGQLTITLSRDADGRPTGGISAARDQGGRYELPFKSVSFDGDRMTAKYDWPEGGEVTHEGTFGEDEAEGTWSFADPSGTTAGGTWKVSRKAAQE